jgi:hypothetical protein
MSLPKTNNTGITSSGSERARDIGSLRAAYHGASQSDKTWEILRLYDKKANGSPDLLEPPAGEPPLSIYEKTDMALYVLHDKPAFTSKTRTAAAPLSFNPSPQAVNLFNKVVERMVIYETNAASSQRLMSDFNLCQDVARPMRDIQITFLHHAFNLESRERVVAVYKLVEEDFFAAWAELEVNGALDNPVFPMNQGLTHAASPVPAWLQKRKARADKSSR